MRCCALLGFEREGVGTGKLRASDVERRSDVFSAQNRWESAVGCTEMGQISLRHDAGHAASSCPDSCSTDRSRVMPTNVGFGDVWVPGGLRRLQSGWDGRSPSGGFDSRPSPPTGPRTSAGVFRKSPTRGSEKFDPRTFVTLDSCTRPLTRVVEDPHAAGNGWATSSAVSEVPAERYRLRSPYATMRAERVRIGKFAPWQLLNPPLTCTTSGCRKASARSMRR